MALYRGIVEGNRGHASRLGSAKSGLTTEANGWKTGARVVIMPDPITGKDLVRVYRTGESLDSTGKKVCEWQEDALAPAFFK